MATPGTWHLAPEHQRGRPACPIWAGRPPCSAGACPGLPWVSLARFGPAGPLYRRRPAGRAVGASAAADLACPIRDRPRTLRVGWNALHGSASATMPMELATTPSRSSCGPSRASSRPTSRRRHRASSSAVTALSVSCGTERPVSVGWLWSSLGPADSPSGTSPI